MGFLEDCYLNVKSGISKATEKTKKVLNISKLKIEMAERRNCINDKYKLIGKYVYDMYKGGEKFEIEDIADWLEEIDALSSSIEECEERLHRAQDKICCHYCKSKNESGSKFCSNCGKKISFAKRGNKSSCENCENEEKNEEDVEIS